MGSINCPMKTIITGDNEWHMSLIYVKTIVKIEK